MINRRISISVSKTINLGNYESAKIQVGLEADISDGVDLKKAYDQMYEEVGTVLADYENDYHGGRK